jgi:hypothetical protein
MSFMHWIEHPSEPKQLLLVWQPPLFVTDRLRWAVGHITRTGDEILFDYLAGEEFARFNNGRTPAELRAAGYVGYPAFDPDSRPDGGYGDYVLKTFLRRLPPTNRRDFPDYLAHYHIPRTAQLSSMALLAITEARLPSDGFSLIDPFDPHAKCVDVVFEVAGYRHITSLSRSNWGRASRWKSILRTLGTQVRSKFSRPGNLSDMLIGFRVPPLRFGSGNARLIAG